MQSRRIVQALTAGVLLTLFVVTAHTEKPFIIVQSTTSTQDTGLFDDLLPKFTEKTGIEVRVVAVETDQALKNAEKGDGDVVLVHSRPDEEKFVAEGHGVKRYDVMYNDFVIIGPPTDPAKIYGLKEATLALKQIADAKALFVSRGDDSGVHKTELELWKQAGVDPKPASGTWYFETGSGMESTLNTAVAKKAYALSDRGTWLRTWPRFKKDDFGILVEGDPKLFNQYGVILVNPEKHPNVKAKEGQAFIDWLTGQEGQAAIADFRILGQEVFFPDAETAANQCWPRSSQREEDVDGTQMLCTYRTRCDSSGRQAGMTTTCTDFPDAAEH